MELKHFRLIKTIAEEGNLANSSEKLFLTQSALSHQLRELESQLGFKVFFRKRNHWELSEQGKELCQLANTLFQSIDEGFANIQQLNEGSKGKVRIGTECYSFYQGLPSFIQKMGILYPDIEVDILLDGIHQPLSKLLSNEIDIAIVSSQPKSEKLKSLEWYRDEIMCVMNQEHPLASADFLEPSHFSDLHLIIHSFPMESVLVHRHFLKPNGVTPRKISAIPFTTVALEMINANMGVSCVPQWTLDPFKLSEQIIFKRIGMNGLKRTLHMVYREADSDKQYIRDFLLNFRDEFYG